MSGRQEVAVVTGGGGGIGAAVAEELGRRGWHVVTVDPLVTLDGTEVLPAPSETTAGRIVAAGGSAQASAASVTDGEALERLFFEVVARRGGIDAVVNVAGITRQTGFAHGDEADWLALLGVHLQGYVNVLRAALPHMAAAGRGRMVGVTSGSGWRPADAGAYSCAKRAVAALTWQLGRLVPPGVTVNAVSPIAATRMVAAALERAKEAARTGARTGSGGGLSLGSMPGPEALGPLGAHLVGDDLAWCTGQVLFAGGTEVALVEEPRLMEVVRSDGLASLSHVLDEVVPRAFLTAEAAQQTSGGGNPRFGAIFGEEAGGGRAGADVRTCAIVSDRAELAAACRAALEARAVTCHHLEPAVGFAACAGALRALVERAGPVDAVVVAPARQHPDACGSVGWEGVLADHGRIVEEIHGDASWARAVADSSAAAGRPVRLVTLTDARSPGGKSRAQSAAQLARAGRTTTDGRVSAFAVSLEAPEDDAARPAGELVAHLVAEPGTEGLGGAELVVGRGWVGLRSHPRPVGSVTYGGPAVPPWLGATLRDMVAGTRASSAGARL